MSSLTPERKLWIWVIQQAILDALSDPELIQANYNKAIVAHLIKRRAIAWFSLSNPPFCRVCELAGFEPAFVLRAYLTLKARVSV